MKQNIFLIPWANFFIKNIYEDRILSPYFQIWINKIFYLIFYSQFWYFLWIIEFLKNYRAASSRKTPSCSSNVKSSPPLRYSIIKYNFSPVWNAYTRSTTKVCWKESKNFVNFSYLTHNKPLYIRIVHFIYSNFFN